MSDYAPIDILPKVSIILLNYNGAVDTIDCLQSLKKVSYLNYNIIIIDNASSDDSMEKIEHYFQEQAHEKYSIFSSPDEAMHNKQQGAKYSLVQTGCNGGYGYGNNVGIKYALKIGADYVLLLNNDTIIDSGFLEPMVYMCEEDKSIGIASGKIYFYDKPDVIWFGGGNYNKYTGNLKHINYNKKDTNSLIHEHSTFITGCLCLIPKFIFEKVGYINEEYFMYAEDLEYSQRVLKSGYKLKVSQKSCIWHKVGGSSGGELTEFSVYWTTKNRLRFMKETMRPFFWPFVFFNVFKPSIKWLFQGNFNLIKSQLNAFYDIPFRVE